MGGFMGSTSANAQKSCCVFWLIIVTATIIGNASGQDRSVTGSPAIVLGPSVHVSTDRPTAPHVESFLAISPRDPDRMVASSISFERGEPISVAYFSRDRGRSWQRS